MALRIVRDRRRRRRVRGAARALWQELCETHGFTFAERRALRQVGSELGLSYPALLFFRPSILAEYLRRHRERLGARRWGRLSRTARTNSDAFGSMKSDAPLTPSQITQKFNKQNTAHKYFPTLICSRLQISTPY